jgi:hypothetical protein
MAETSETLKQDGTVSLEAAVPTARVFTGPTIKEEEQQRVE